MLIRLICCQTLTMALLSNIIDINQWRCDSIVAFIIRKIKLISLRSETKRTIVVACRHCECCCCCWWCRCWHGVTCNSHGQFHGWFYDCIARSISINWRYWFYSSALNVMYKMKWVQALRIYMVILGAKSVQTTTNHWSIHMSSSLLCCYCCLKLMHNLWKSTPHSTINI